MGKLSDAHANMILDLFFSKAANTSVPATIYVGLSSTTPTNTGTNVTEPSTGSYARVGLTNNATNFPAAAARAKSNGTVVNFATATADWVAGADLTHFVLYDAITAGNFVAWGALDTPQPVLNGTQASFAVGALDITAPGA